MRPKCKNNQRRFIPGHKSFLQGSVTDNAPTQFLPPFAGAGLLHFLVFVMVPPPQVLLHALNADHFDKPPSTETRKKNNTIKHDLNWKLRRFYQFFKDIVQGRSNLVTLAAFNRL